MEKFDIKLRGQFKSITTFEWNDIPKLSIITGINGVGKTHLLRLIHHLVLNEFKPDSESKDPIVDSSISIEKSQLISPFGYSYSLPSYIDSKGMTVGQAYSLPIALKKYAIEKERDKVFENYKFKLNKKYVPKMEQINKLRNSDLPDDKKKEVRKKANDLHNEYSEKEKELKYEANDQFVKEINKLDNYKKNIPGTNNVIISDESEYKKLIFHIESVSKKKVFKMTPEEILFYVPVNEIIKSKNDFLSKLDFLILIHEEKKTFCGNLILILKKETNLL